MRPVLALALAFALLLVGCSDDDARVVVGSKKFTESVVLGEIVTQLASGAAPATHRRDLGGTRILFEGLKRGDIDAYPDYTGTVRYELLADAGLEPDEPIEPALAELGIGVIGPIGFNNTYAIGMTEARAAELGITRVSDLTSHPELALAFSNEFMDRADGWPGLRDTYRLPQSRVRGVDHDLAYRGLIGGSVDAMDLYSTDAEIAYYGLRVLRDDRAYFPRYDAVLLYRLDMETRAPRVVEAWRTLAGAIDEPRMQHMNELAKIDRVPEAIVAQSFLESLGITTEVEVESLSQRLFRTTLEQLTLVGVSTGLAIAAAVPLGLLAARVRALEQVILSITGLLQTIPALALLVLLIPLFGLSPMTAIAALFAYGLLPITRNTHAGVKGIPRDVRESAAALGLRPAFALLRIELPLAMPMILAGIKTAAVVNVGTATLAALIGAGGYGQPILTGIRLDDFGLILEGAVPAAAMALAAQGLLDLSERGLVSRGLRQRGG